MDDTSKIFDGLESYDISEQGVVKTSKIDVDTMLADLRTVVKQSLKHGAKTISSTAVLFPAATSTTLAKDIGLIVGGQASVAELAKANLILPPDNLQWLEIKTYEALKAFLENRGIPGYISFDYSLAPTKDAKTGIDCAQLFTKHCAEKKLKSLPPYQCHCTVQSNKQKIEMLLLDY